MTQTSPSRRSSPDSPPGRPRDGLLDLLRSLSITRVIGIHLIGRSGFWFWPAPTYVLPGMPMVFFVSGALVRKTLGTVDGAVAAGEGMAIYMQLDEPTLREVARTLDQASKS